jgi:iron(III) transport system substrate-binding protein
VTKRNHWRFDEPFIALLFSVSAGPVLAQSQPVTITAYTSLQKEVLAPYEAAFRKAHPEIQIAWVRDAGGVIHSRKD